MNTINKLISVDKAIKIEGKESKKIYKEYMNPALANMLSLLNFDKKFIKAKGAEVWDEEKNIY